MMKRFALAAAIVLGLSTPSFAGDISVENVWARASAGMARAGAAFLTIKNPGKLTNWFLRKQIFPKKSNYIHISTITA